MFTGHVRVSQQCVMLEDLSRTFSESAGALLVLAEASTPLNPPNPVPPPKVEAEPNTGVGDAACTPGLISDKLALHWNCCGMLPSRREL